MDSDANDPGAEQYRRVIDDLVRSCREGQGQIVPKRVRAGQWRGLVKDADDEVLAPLTEGQREHVAQIAADAYVDGVHEALVVLEANGVIPFDRGYEGTPYHDFIGRLTDWEWPDEPRF